MAGAASAPERPPTEDLWKLIDQRKLTTIGEDPEAIDPNEEYMMGIDEAGRGPVLGPMVYGTCFCPVSKLEQLKALKCADSKTLSEAQREGLFEVIRKSNFVGWKVTSIPPCDISRKSLARRKVNLNEQSFDTAFNLIRAVLAAGIKIAELYVDTVGKAETYENKIRAAFPTIPSVKVAPKADSLFPIVSAASICAKVTRDALMSRWSFARYPSLKPDNKTGCGYPGDSATVSWLERNLDPVFGYPDIVRFSWSTITLALEKKGVPVIWEDDEDELPKGQGTLRWGGAALTAAAPKADRFFKMRKLQREASFF
eukprot:tig00020943_g16283.t1